MGKFHTIVELDLKGKRVLLRTDLDVPCNDAGDITDDSRIRAAIPSIKYIADQGGKVVILAHRGRPDGHRSENLSLSPIAHRLSQLLKKNVAFAPDCIGDAAEKMTTRMQNGEILVLENVRFHQPEIEEEGRESFVKELAKMGDLYVNDAFATAHRKHASTYDLPKEFESPVAGFLMEKEVLVLTNLLTHAESPFYAIIGGSKISSKIGVLEALFPKIDGLFIGGAMVFTFMKALDLKVGNSLLDEDHIDTAKYLMKKMRSKGIECHLPKDLVVANAITHDAETQIVSFEDGIEDGWIGVDIGPETIKAWKEPLDHAGTVFWNGPMGIFEIKEFAHGTLEIAKILADSNAMSIVGGGDSAAAVRQSGVSQKITRISTGGGATLEFIELGTLPCIEILQSVEM